MGIWTQTHIANQEDVIKKILKHLGFWKVERKLRPKANAPPFMPDSYPIPSVDNYVIDPDLPSRSLHVAASLSRSDDEFCPKLVPVKVGKPQFEIFHGKRRLASPQFTAI